MSKAPTTRADALQAMREAKYGHLQAKAEPAPAPIPRVTKTADELRKTFPAAKMGRPKNDKPARKLIPFAGKDSGKAIAPKEPAGTSGKPKPGRARVKRKRRTELPPEKETT